MARKKYTTEQIIQHLRTIEIEAGKGMTIEDAVRKHDIPIQSYYRWKKEYAGMDLSQAKKEILKIVVDGRLRSGDLLLC